jgi:hypothetical protein
VLPILFLLYLRGVFGAVEHKVPGIRTLSFADDIGLIASGSSVQQVSQKLQLAAAAAIAWGHENMVEFDPGKTEAVLFARGTGRELRARIQATRIEVGGVVVPYATGATRWLGVLLDPKLTLKTHYTHRLHKAQNVERRI